MILIPEKFDKLKVLKDHEIYLFLNQLTPLQRSIYRETLTNKSASVLEKITEIYNYDQYLISTNTNVEKDKLRRGNNLFYNDVSPVSPLELLNDQELNSNLSNLYLFRYYPNQLFIKKFSNFLMIHGLKHSSMKIILEFFEILKRSFHILNPIEILRKFLFINLVPVIKPKTVGFKVKKVIGISLSIYKRISLSFKLFIKGARSHKVPMAEGLVIEFFNFYKEKTLLQQTNVQTLALISENNLYKTMQLGYNSEITPEKFYMIENFDKVGSYKFSDLLEIDWENFNDIILYLYDYNLKRKLFRQLCILEQLKFCSFQYVILNKDKFEINNNLDFEMKGFNYKDYVEYIDIINSNKFNNNLSFEDFLKEKQKSCDRDSTNNLLDNSSITLVKDLNEVEINYILDDSIEIKHKKFKETGDYFYRYSTNYNIESFFFFKDQLIRRLSINVIENLKRTDFIDFYNCQNPNNIDLEIIFEQFKDLPLTAKIFKKIPNWDLEEFKESNLENDL